MTVRTPLNPAHPPTAWGDDMRLTPADVQTTSFRKAPFGRRGFDEEQVQEFLARVEQEFVELLNEKAQFQDECGRLRKRVLETDGDGARPEDAHVQSVHLPSRAQQTADQYVADAERYSRELAGEARRHYDEVLADARSRAVMLLEEAHGRASDAASAVGAQSMRDSMPMSAEDRRDLEGEVAYLRTFSQVYRTHLRSYLEALLHNVEEWERSENSSIGHARGALVNGNGVPHGA
jgi:DivIVA domain-containing protein